MAEYDSKEQITKGQVCCRENVCFFFFFFFSQCCSWPPIVLIGVHPYAPLRPSTMVGEPLERAAYVGIMSLILTAAFQRLSNLPLFKSTWIVATFCA